MFEEERERRMALRKAKIKSHEEKTFNFKFLSRVSTQTAFKVATKI